MRALLRPAAVLPVSGLCAAVLVVLSASPSAASTVTGSTTTTVTTPAGSGAASNPFCSRAIFATVQQRVEQALADRVSQLQGLAALVQSSSSDLTPSDQAALVHDITVSELPGIESLQPEVQQVTTCAELRQDARTMVDDYRVYLVMTPQTHETVVADRETDISGKLTALEPTVQSAIAWAGQHGRNVTGAQTAFADMQARLSAATSTLSGLSATLLAQTPPGYPGNAAVFLTGRTDETNGRNDLRSAFDDLAAIARDLGVPGVAATTTTTT